MVRIKRFLIIVLTCMFVACTCLCFVGCIDKPNEEDENKKYDVTMKIKNNFGKEWIFTPDISELTYEFEYTGEEMTFYLAEYNLPDHPRWSNDWLTPSGEGANVFSKTMVYTDVYGNSSAGNRTVKDKGEYSICYTANSTSDLWNFRYIYLFIKVI